MNPFHDLYGHLPLRAKRTRLRQIKPENLVDPTQLKYRKNDEVAVVRNGRLIFGVLEYPEKKTDGTVGWRVRWNYGEHDEEAKTYSYPLTTFATENELILSNRPLYKGCKVRRLNDDKIGVCRDVIISADLRVTGTMSTITNVNLNFFKHLKEFKQKSVVYKSGWLGVVTEVSRIVTIRLETGTSHKVQLTSLMPLKPLELEEPSINEEIDLQLFCANGISTKEMKESGLSTALLDRNTTLFIEDLEVESVKVHWRYQVDVQRPDHPPELIKGSRIKDIQVIMEDFCSVANFQVGNLGRYKIIDEDCVRIRSFDDYSRNYILKNKEELADQLRRFPARANAYDNDALRIKVGRNAVIEIVRTSSVGQVIWKDGTYEYVRSVDLIIQDKSLIDNIPTPGDFIYSQRLSSYGSKENIYGVVSQYNLATTTVTCQVLSCEAPPAVLNSKISLAEKDVYPHPRYKYFNQYNTVAVMTKDGCALVGHVRRTNPSGKVQVYWNKTDKEDWIWPAECSLYNVKGHDLECIISLINDEDEIKDDGDLKSKFLGLVKKIHNFNDLWSEVVEVEEADDSPLEYLKNIQKMREQSLKDLEGIVSNFRDIELEACQAQRKRDGQLFHENSISVYFDKIKETLSVGEHDKNYTNPQFVDVLKNLFKDLLSSCDILLEVCFEKTNEVRTLRASEMIISTQAPVHLQSGSSEALQEPALMDTDLMEANLPETLQPVALEATLTVADIFTPNVVIEENCPEFHKYARYEFKPTQIGHFIKIVKNELNNLRDQCPPEIKVKGFGDRYDLFSIIIGGPQGTPYENSLYLFDACLPPDYPSLPPVFHFHSYRAGRLNPNLYDEGKVCLSLLGTWASRNQTEQWTKESTMVQVLLSIQALILVNEPFHNEPAFDRDVYSKSGRSPKDDRLVYNRDLMPKIMRMMINQIENPMDPWKEEMKAYYKINLPLFIARWKLWLSVAKSVSSEKEFLAKLSPNDLPGFQIYPFSKADELKKIIRILQKLCDQLIGAAPAEGLEVNQSMNEEMMEVEPQPDQPVNLSTESGPYSVSGDGEGDPSGSVQ